MAIYSKAEFARKYGQNTGYITTMVKRAKIILNDNGDIDSENPINKVFHDNQMALQARKASNPTEAPPKKKVAVKARKVAPAPEKREPTALEGKIERKVDLEIEERQIRQQKISQEIQMMKLRQEKLTGQSIPTDLAASVVRQLAQSMMVAFSEGADAIVNDYAKIAGINREKLAKMRKQMRELVNNCINRSVNEASKNIDNIIDEHSQGRKAA
jgi:hypothetical protein